MKTNVLNRNKSIWMSALLACMTLALFFNGVLASEKTYQSSSIPIREIFSSAAAHDGWILETFENSNKGGTSDKNANTLLVGDDVRSRQYKSILSFNTSTIPSNAVIACAKLKLKKQGYSGDPFTTLGDLTLDIRGGTFSQNVKLQPEDFSAFADGSQFLLPASTEEHTYEASITGANLNFISKAGITQFRLRFSLDDNNNRATDTLRFFSGHTADGTAPQLEVIHYIGPNPPAPISPLPDDIAIAGSVSFSWGPVSDATEYQVYILDEASNLVHASGWINTTSYFRDLNSGKYRWYVKSRNSNGESFTCEDPSKTFEVIDPPTISLPANESVVFSGSTNFVWNPVSKTGPGGAAEYQLEITDLSGTPLYTSGWMVQTSLPVSIPTGQYQWHVRARNSTSTSYWSSYWNLTVSDPPALVFPSYDPNDPANIPTVFAGVTTFSWNTVPENVGVSGSTEYYFEYDNAPEFDTPLGNCTWGTSTDCPVNLTAGTYYWHVKAHNTISTSDWSATWVVNVSDPPVLLSPADGSILFTDAVNFTWNTVAGATQYCLAYGNGDCDTPSSSASGWIGGTNYSISLPAGTYQWHVKARNETSLSQWSETWSLTLAAPPVPISPIQNAELGTVGSFYPITPLSFSWSPVPSNTFSGPTNYYYEVDESPFFDTPQGNSWNAATDSTMSLKPGAYYWRVKARNSISESGWSEVRTFIYLDLFWTNDSRWPEVHAGYPGYLNAAYSSATQTHKYRFHADPAWFDLSLARTSGDLIMTMELYDENMNLKGSIQGPGDSLFIHDWMGMPTGTYYWVIIKVVSGSGTYVLRLDHPG